MKKNKLFISILVGLVAGQIFADSGNRPFSIINTMRIGYDDNIYMQEDSESASMYFEDGVDLSFNASLSDRTDILFRSLFLFSTDNADTTLDPNLYVVLSHSVSPRLLLQLSNVLRSGHAGGNNTADKRYDYWINTTTFEPTYVLTSKDRVSLPVSYEMKRHDGKEVEKLDYTTAKIEASWERELRPQRTTSSLNLSHKMTEYDNRDSEHDSTRLSVGLSHTFNQEWHGTIGGGVAYNQPDFADTPGFSPENGETFSPEFNAGLTYVPTPRSRISANISHGQSESRAYTYGSSMVTELELSAQHDFTAKIMGKATARFQQSDYDKDDSENGKGSTESERMQLELQLNYKINRVNFLELRYKYTDKSGDHGEWDQNRIDMGWRVEL